jgi:hypothetical protein
MLGKARPRLARGAACGLLGVLLIVGIPLDWHYDPFVDMRYGEHVELFEAADAGTRIMLPLNPVGWSMVLVKR